MGFFVRLLIGFHIFFHPCILNKQRKLQKKSADIYVLVLQLHHLWLLELGIYCFIVTGVMILVTNTHELRLLWRFKDCNKGSGKDRPAMHISVAHCNSFFAKGLHSTSNLIYVTSIKTGIDCNSKSIYNNQICTLYK